MNMKRPLAFLLAAGMTLGLAACGGNGGTSGSGSSGSSGSADGSAVTLDLWAFNIGGFTEASNWDTILAAFNEQHPDITVNVTPINLSGRRSEADLRHHLQQRSRHHLRGPRAHRGQLRP